MTFCFNAVAKFAYLRLHVGTKPDRSSLLFFPSFFLFFFCVKFLTWHFTGVGNQGLGMKRELCICMRGVGNRMVFDLFSGSAPVLARFAFFFLVHHVVFKGKRYHSSGSGCLSLTQTCIWRAGFSSVFRGFTWMYHQCYLDPRISRILRSVLPYLDEMSYGMMK